MPEKPRRGGCTRPGVRWAAMKFWTIGHSNHPLDLFLSILKAYPITMLADVRRFPSSRKFPHFNQGQLTTALAAIEIRYEAFPELGGRRRASPDSHNTAWRNASFRGYADYMETVEFQQGIARLLAAAATRRIALMCSEVLWWRCHRALISDDLKCRGYEVVHIQDAQHSTEHPYTSAARIIGGELRYTAESQGTLDLD